MEEIKIEDFDEALKDNDFKYSWKDINKIIDERKLTKVIMLGVKEDLEKLKDEIEQIYTHRVFYLSYWESECPFHGWSWSKDDGSMRNMATITDDITTKFEEIYALILSGLGMRFVCENDVVYLKKEDGVR